MTTTVFIESPNPNHLDLQVEYQDLDDEGNWNTTHIEIVRQGQKAMRHVYAKRRVVISEIERS